MGARASIVTTHGEMLDACMVVGRINQAESWRYLQMDSLSAPAQQGAGVSPCPAMLGPLL